MTRHVSALPTAEVSALQLNIYVPKGKEQVLARLDSLSRNSGKPKNEIVLEALEGYLHSAGPTRTLGVYPSRVIGSLSRRDIYGDRRHP